MRKWVLLAALLAALCMLTGCGAGPAREDGAAPSPEPVLPGAVEENAVRQSREVTLWFRYLDEPCLAPETRAVARTPGKAWEMTVLEALLSGPDTRSLSLNGLFPEGTRVLATARQGRTLFVTLNREALEALPDEPVDWQEDDAWRVEAPLRRRLTMQSLTATLTENCDVDRVQVLVEQGDDLNASLRLKRNYFLDDSEDDVLTGPLTRDESLLLTPAVSLRVALSCWQRHDWERLYRYIAASDPDTGLTRPVYRDFVTVMEALPSLLDFSAEGGSVSASGDRATFSLGATLLLEDGREDTRTGCVVRLQREGGLWKISREQLTAWLEVE